MVRAESYDRYELKYLLGVEAQETIRERIAPFTERDLHALDRPDFIYTVRSAYFDTDDLQYYYERQDGLKVRKKLRARVYNEANGTSPLFLEIKRKFNRRIFKERIAVPRASLDVVLNGVDPHPERHLLDSSLPARHSLGRFRYILTAAALHPVVLVAYEREAFVGRENHRVRVTFDMNLRSQMHPSLDGLCCEDDLRVFLSDHFVLELKFDVVMPEWMRRMVRQLGLSARPYSKYCFGIDAWHRLTV